MQLSYKFDTLSYQKQLFQRYIQNLFSKLHQMLNENASYQKIDETQFLVYQRNLIRMSVKQFTNDIF